MSNKIFLVGLPGSGKSTVGRLLAQKLQCDFVDMDEQIERTTGKKISAIFAESGEETFRDIETEALQKLVTSDEALVISTGGGVVLRPQNREALTSQKYVIYLLCPPQALYKRIGGDNTRPLLQTDDPLAKLVELSRIREPYYNEVAKYCLDINSCDPATATKTIFHWLENQVG